MQKNCNPFQALGVLDDTLSAGGKVSPFLQRNLIESTINQIVFTIFGIIWNQTDVHLVLNQLENGKYNRISG